MRNPYLIAAVKGAGCAAGSRAFHVEINYTIELRDLRDLSVSSISLASWLEEIEYANVIFAFGDVELFSRFHLTPVSAIVPWLRAGLREAVGKNFTGDLLEIIQVVKGSVRDEELDTIERSLRQTIGI